MAWGNPRPEGVLGSFAVRGDACDDAAHTVTNYNVMLVTRRDDDERAHTQHLGPVSPPPFPHVGMPDAGMEPGGS